MSIRFKFRSSVNFDTVDIGGRESISVRELRSKILSEKTLGAGRQQHQDFDLVFLDADSGQEYKDGDITIPSGSSVIVKRVPAGAVPSDLAPVETVKGLEVKVSCQMNPISKPVHKFEDFGSDFCRPPEPDANCLDFNLEFDQNNLSSSDKYDITRLRSGCQKLDSCDISQAVPRGSNHNGNERNTLQEPTAEELMKLAKNRPANFVALQNANFPLELKCSLCNTFFKDAVMIPCCQHSFCEKCICLVLIEKGRCPKCFSSKCRVEDLLPNLSLRNAIKHCLESQMLDAGFETAAEKYAPDEESGIEVKKDASCALTVVHREAELPQSSSATGIGSNQLFTESYYEPVVRRNTVYKGSDSQRGNLPSDIPRAHIHGEGGDRNFLAHSGYKKGLRNCYTCGSPDHLMRDCPLASNIHPFQQGIGAFHGGVQGYPHPYWNGSMLPFRPYANMYRNPTVMPFNVSMVPVAPFAVPSYFPSTGVGLHMPRGNMGTGGMGPPAESRVERSPFSNLELQHFEDRKKLPNENFGREKLLDEEDSHECRRDNKPNKPHRFESMKEKEHSLSRSEDSKTQRSQRKYQHDNCMDYDNRYVDERLEKSSRSSSLRAKRLHHSERSNSGIEALSRSSDRHSERRHKDHHGESKHHKRVECDSDSSLTRSPSKKDVRCDVVVARDLHVDRRRECKERDSGRDSRHSRHLSKHSVRERYEDKWQMVSGSNDYKDDYRHHKRKRVF